MASAAAAIEAHGLVKRYGDLVAVAGIDLEAQPGSCVGLLGPNGAGKTTTIEILEGLSAPDGGEVRILGQSWATGPHFIRERIGVQLQETKLHEKLTVLETLRLFGSLYAEARPPSEVASLIGLTEKRAARVGELSGGQKQRLALGCALINHPDVLFLDEPTTGLDPQARRLVWEIVEEFKQSGGTVLLTTHYMDEAERLADDLVILDHGKVIARGAPSALVRSLGADSLIEYEVTAASDPEVRGSDLDALRNLAGVVDARRLGNHVTLTVTDAQAALASVLSYGKATQTTISSLSVHRATLEDVFVALTGKHLRDD